MDRIINGVIKFQSDVFPDHEALFGELYLDLTSDLKLTLGARYNIDTKDIRDRRIYNCYAESGTSNPHKFYGYLMNGACTQLITDWIK